MPFSVDPIYFLLRVKTAVRLRSRDHFKLSLYENSPRKLNIKDRTHLEIMDNALKQGCFNIDHMGVDAIS